MKIDIYQCENESEQNGLIQELAHFGYSKDSDIEKISKYFIQKIPDVEIADEVFAKGSTCECHKIISTGLFEGKIIKFFTYSDNDFSYGENLKNFLTQQERIKPYLKEYKRAELPIVNKQTIVNTSKGYALLCDELPQGTLENHYSKTENQSLGAILKTIYKILLDVSRAHSAGLVLLDIKPQNLCVFSADDDGLNAVRSIDFGSMRSIEDICKQVESCEDKLMAYSLVLNCSDPYYYAQNDINECINVIWEGDKEKSEIALKKLDLKAIAKIFLRRLLNITWEETDTADYKTVIKNYCIGNFATENTSNKDFIDAICVYYSLENLVNCMINGECLSDGLIEQIIRILILFDIKINSYKKLQNDAYLYYTGVKQRLKKWGGLEIVNNPSDLFKDAIKLCEEKGVNNVADLVYIQWFDTQLANVFNKEPFLISLFPAIKGSKKIFETDTANNIPSIIQVADEILRNKSKAILLKGEGSIGKTTSMQLLYSYFLKKGISCFFIELNQLNNPERASSVINKLEERADSNTIVFFDGYDELLSTIQNKPTTEYIDKLIQEKKYSLIVSSRFEKYRIIKTESKKGEKKKESIFKDYSIYVLDDFSDNQIDNIIKRYSIGEEITKEIRNLLKNTMFMSLLIKIHEKLKNDPSKIKELQKVKDEEAFFSFYFENLFNEKNRGHMAETYLNAIGKSIYYNLLGGTLKKEPDIPAELKGIYGFEKKKSGYTIKTSQIKYANYALATYLYDRLYMEGAENIEYTVVIEKLGQSIHNLKKRYMQDYVLTDAGTFIYLGQKLLKENNHEIKERIVNTIRMLLKKKGLVYVSALYIILGYLNGIIDDEQFDMGKDFLEQSSTYGFFENNPYLKRLNTRYAFIRCNRKKWLDENCPSRFDIIIPDDIKLIKPGAISVFGSGVRNITIGKRVKVIRKNAFGFFSNFEKITVREGNHHFYVKDNCLMDKNGAMYACGSNFTIPEETREIKDDALSRSERLQAIIPTSIRKIGLQKAFLYFDEESIYIDNYAPQKGFPLNDNTFLNSSRKDRKSKEERKIAKKICTTSINQMTLYICILGCILSAIYCLLLSQKDMDINGLIFLCVSGSVLIIPGVYVVFLPICIVFRALLRDSGFKFKKELIKLYKMLSAYSLDNYIDLSAERVFLYCDSGMTDVIDDIPNSYTEIEYNTIVEDVIQKAILACLGSKFPQSIHQKAKRKCYEWLKCAGKCEEPEPILRVLQRANEVLNSLSIKEFTDLYQMIMVNRDSLHIHDTPHKFYQIVNKANRRHRRF